MQEKQRCKICGSSTKCGCEDLYLLFEPSCSDRVEIRRGAISEPCDEDVGNRKLSAILERLRTLWLRRTPGRRVSRLDGQTIFSDADWTALSESALFEEPGEGGGGAPCQTLPPSATTSRGMAGVGSIERGGRLAPRLWRARPPARGPT